MEDNDPTIKGVVVALKANYFIVEIKNNGRRLDIDNTMIKLLCTKRNKLSYQGSFVCVGDFVTLEAVDCNSFTAVIKSIEPRKSFINRPALSNFTHVFVVLSLEDPKFERTQATRFLLKAEETGEQVSLIVTKSDLIDPKLLNYNINRFKEWGYEAIAISIVSGFGIDQLLKKLGGIDLGILCGPSGVGKSSLVKYLLPEKNISIGTLSKKLKRGRNTTRHVELFSLSNGHCLADTPGFNKPELTFNPEMLPKLFPEIRLQLETHRCKFRNCLHLDEPGCAISRDWERYPDYKNFLEDIMNSHR